jgi:uncharacterized protein
MDAPLTLLLASLAAFGLAMLSAVAGFGGGVLLLPVFTALFELRVAVPMLTLTQLSSNGSRIWFNRGELRWSLIGWFALGAVPCAAAGGLLLTHAPLAPLKRVLGVFLIGVVFWRRWQRRPRTPSSPAFAAVGAVSGLGSGLLGSVGPLTAPFFLAVGLTRGAYVGTEAASALVMHLTKIAVYGTGELLTREVLLYGVVLTPATLLGAWVGKKIVGRISDRVFVLLVEVGLIVAGTLFLIGL